jgi:DNA-binding NtrC family response regulator
MRHLSQLNFAGNVRELRNLLERTALMCDGQVIELSHLEAALGTAAGAPSVAAGVNDAAVGAQPPLGSLPPGGAAPVSLHDIELAVLREQVRQHRGGRAELAAKLGISERSLYRKLKELEAQEPPNKH